MEEDGKVILIKSVEKDTGILYTFLISPEDGKKILDNKGASLIELEKGIVRFNSGSFFIQEGTSNAFLEADEVLEQIEEQLNSTDKTTHL